MLKVPGHIYSCNNLPNSGALEWMWPSGHGHTKILTKRGCVYFFFYSLPDLVVIVDFGLSKSSGRNGFCWDQIANIEHFRRFLETPDLPGPSRRFLGNSRHV